MKKFLRFSFAICFVFSWLVSSACSSFAQDIFVSAGQSIQAAIGSASDGDAIQVAPGTYFENLDFLGKSISVQSVGGAGVTIIDGGNIGPVARFANNESRAATLTGFTLQNGVGGVSIFNSSPTISGNIVSDNRTSRGGGGIAVSGGQSLIQGNSILNNRASNGYGVELAFTNATVVDNTIRFNTRFPGSGGVGGGGIAIRGAGNAQVLDNWIDSNVTSADGGGISLFAAGNPVIIGNSISNNSASSGGGISHANRSDSLIAQNLIFGNVARIDGGGVDWLTSSGSNGPRLINNTIALNSAGGEGSAVFADGFDQNALLASNILFGIEGQNAVGIGNLNDVNDPMFLNNIIYSPSGQAVTSASSTIIGVDGNVEIDPLFWDLSNDDFRVSLSSAAIDGGLNELIEELVSFDFGGNSRIYDGNFDGVFTVDIGAFEAVPEPSSIILILSAVMVASFRRRSV